MVAILSQPQCVKLVSLKCLTWYLTLPFCCMAHVVNIQQGTESQHLTTLTDEHCGSSQSLVPFDDCKSQNDALCCQPSELMIPLGWSGGGFTVGGWTAFLTKVSIVLDLEVSFSCPLKRPAWLQAVLHNGSSVIPARCGFYFFHDTLKLKVAILAWFLPVVLTDTYLHTMYTSKSSYLFFLWELHSITGKMQFNIHLVIFALGWNVAPFQKKWEIPFVPLSSVHWRLAAFNHKDAD